MDLIKNDHQHIVGWGSDADKSSRPNYPMWQKPKMGTGAHWATPEQQTDFNDFHSIERGGHHTHVFGNTIKPKGLSGLIRKKAFTYGESQWNHWMMLLLADRVNVYEGLWEDLMHGVRPKLLAERGWSVDKKFKTKRYKKVVMMGAFAVVTPLLFLIWKKKP